MSSNLLLFLLILTLAFVAASALVERWQIAIPLLFWSGCAGILLVWLITRQVTHFTISSTVSEREVGSIVQQVLSPVVSLAGMGIASVSLYFRLIDVTRARAPRARRRHWWRREAALAQAPSQPQSVVAFPVAATGAAKSRAVERPTNTATAASPPVHTTPVAASVTVNARAAAKRAARKQRKKARMAARAAAAGEVRLRVEQSLPDERDDESPDDGEAFTLAAMPIVHEPDGGEIEEVVAPALPIEDIMTTAVTPLRAPLPQRNPPPERQFPSPMAHLVALAPEPSLPTAMPPLDLWTRLASLIIVSAIAIGVGAAVALGGQGHTEWIVVTVALDMGLCGLSMLILSRQPDRLVLGLLFLTQAMIVWWLGMAGNRAPLGLLTLGIVGWAGAMTATRRMRPEPHDAPAPLASSQPEGR